MEFNSSTIRGLFDGSKVYNIPTYQRAYSWERPQLQMFLEDLIEQIKVKNQNEYYYGNVLLETIVKDREYEIVDGQQRMTTVVIFVRSMINILLEREDIGDIDLTDLESTYIKSKNIKLSPVNYDRGFFTTSIVENKETGIPNTPSQQRIKDAKNYFTIELRKISTPELKEILRTLEDARVNRIEFKGKTEASLMFELQNNRGKDLTNLEKLKSFFMYQMYVHSPNDETDYNVGYVSDKFTEIYVAIQDYKFGEVTLDDDDTTPVKLSEDTILLYHAYAFTRSHFGYRSIQEIIGELKTIDDKPLWIRNFVDELYKTFDNIKWLATCRDEKLSDLIDLKMPSYIYPFLIKGMSMFKQDSAKMKELFSILEKVVFRVKLISTRANINSRLNDAIREFDSDLTKLQNNFYQALEYSWYWSDARFEEKLKGSLYGNPVTKYLLWKYEEHLQTKGYRVTVKIDDVAEEHIAPRTESNEGITSGYEVDENGKYSKEFTDEYLSCIGNLLLISQSHNSSIGNKSFSEKLKSYKEVVVMKQQLEIEDYCKDAEGNIVEFWGTENIRRRKADIVSFALSKWNLRQTENEEV